MVFLYSSDRNYAKLSMVSIASLLENNQDAENVKIYYINNNIGLDYEDKLNKLVHSFNREIIYIDASTIDTSFIKRTSFAISGYYRILITEMIQESKIIYLDCDTVINGSFADLWNMSLDGFLFGCVKDTVQNYIATSIGQENNSYYINSGFVYMNLQECRNSGFDKKVKDYFAEFDGLIPHHDQGIINALGYQKMLYLNPKYNLTSQYLSYSVAQLCKLFSIDNLYSQTEIDIAKQSPVVIHFLNYNYGRPWEEGCKHPYLYLFEKYSRDYDINIKLRSSSDKFGTKLRKIVFWNFPFYVHLFIEKYLDRSRKSMFYQTYKKNEKK